MKRLIALTLALTALFVHAESKDPLINKVTEILVVVNMHYGGHEEPGDVALWLEGCDLLDRLGNNPTRVSCRIVRKIERMPATVVAGLVVMHNDMNNSEPLDADDIRTLIDACKVDIRFLGGTSSGCMSLIVAEKSMSLEQIASKLEQTGEIK